MAKEDYVSFETAVYLKENGFKGRCNADYRLHTNNDVEFEVCDWLMSYDDGIPENIFLAPTQEDADKFINAL